MMMIKAKESIVGKQWQIPFKEQEKDLQLPFQKLGFLSIPRNPANQIVGLAVVQV